MDYTRLGSSGLKVSRISLGCMSYGDGSRERWALDYDGAAPNFRQAIDLGITFWDTANARVVADELDRLAFVHNVHPTAVRLSESTKDSSALGAATLVIHQQLGGFRRGRDVPTPPRLRIPEPSHCPAFKSSNPHPNHN